MNKKLFLFIFTLTFSLLGSSIKAEEQSKHKEPFYSQLNRAVIRLEHYGQLRFEGSDRIKTFNKAVGTAFFVWSENDLFVVTARHVVEKDYDLHARVQTKNEKTGETEVILLQLPRDRWAYHSEEGNENTHYVDVAAMKIRGIKDRSVKYFRYEPKDSKEHQKNQLPFKDPQPPDAILVFGFPGEIGFKISEQRPFGRLGIVSTSAGKKFLEIRINNAYKFAEEKACLIDVEAFPGNSGSPVINQFMRLIDDKIRLLGLLIGTNRKMDYALIEPVSRIRETLEMAKKQSVIDLIYVSFWFSAKRLSNKGAEFIELGRYEKALEAVDKAIELKPDCADAWYNRACIYSLKKDKESALRNLSRAIELDVKFKETARNDEDFKNLWDDEDFRKIVPGA